MADFLLELLSEEIPARMQANARNELARLFAECTSAAGLETGPIDVHSTPRRLVLIAHEIADATQPSSEETKGPRVSSPPQALEGFLRKTGLTRDRLEERDGVYFAVVERPGRTAAEILAEAVKRIIAEFPWPKSMRWDDGSLRWVRPLHGIVAMLGEEIVRVEVGGITSGATTFGHRFHHPGAITVGGAQDYAEKLRACHVIVDQEERERIIREGAQALAAEAGLSLVSDEGLVVENAGLTEWPVPLLGAFDADFLDVPREVIVLTMRTNQKYFACIGPDGGLAPAFVCVANVAASDNGAAIVEGNRRVLAARLADARFFWEQDLKVPLEEQAKKLDGIVFHEKLGTVADKVERVAKLAGWLVESGVVEADAGQVERAARLAKADLVSGMVGEFPELQGVIGGYLAEAQGEPKPIAEAIRDHYKPAGQGDEVPTEAVTVAVALADKLDSLFAFFRAGMFPTGSKDPYALRRAAIGAISLILENELRMHTDAPAEFWLGQSDAPKELTDGEISDRSILTTVPDFLLDRLQVQQRDNGIRHDLIAASARWASRDDGRLDRVVARATALQSLVETREGADLLTAYKRAANILKKEEWDIADVESGSAPAEETLLNDALILAENAADEAILKEDFARAMEALASLRGPIDAFFDKVTVNADERGVRARRLNLLTRFRDAVNRVADFSKIEG